MTVLVEKTTDTRAASAVEESAPNILVRWHIRAAALLVDVLPGAAVISTMALTWLASPPRSVWWWASICVLVVATALTTANRAVAPAILGWSIGRALFGIEVVRPHEGPVGVGRLLCREVAHLLDTFSVFVGWLWPLWDPRCRTFADLLLSTEVRYAAAERRPVDARRNAATAGGAAVLLCVGGALVSVFAILMPARASDQTRVAVSAQGPDIVTQLLTYDPKSLKQDFERALALTTAKYRPELARQQESVQKGHPVVNEYWVTDSTVLSATPDAATMLLFMQGHRGGADTERFISATVRVALAKSAEGRWLVDNLDVVTKPKPAPAKGPNPPKEPAPAAPPRGQK